MPNEQLPADRFATARQFADALSGAAAVPAPVSTLAHERQPRARGVKLLTQVAPWGGIAAAAGEEWNVAERHFTNAFDLATALPHVPGQGEVHRWRPWMLLTRRAPGDVERAYEMLKEAIELFDRLGLTRRARECRAMLGEV